MKLSEINQKLTTSIQTGGDRDEIIMLAKDRRELLLELLLESSDGPEKLLDNIFTEESIKQFPQYIQDSGYLERYIHNWKGKATVTITENFNTHESQTSYKIDSYNSYFVGGPPDNLMTDSQVSIKDSVNLSNYLIIKTDGSPNVQLLSTHAIKTTGNIKVGVILFNFANDNSPLPYSDDNTVKNILTTDDNLSAAKYIKEVSDGNVNLSVDVFGWYPIKADKTEMNNDGDNCNYRVWADKAKEAASGGNPLVNFYWHQYDRLVFLFPHTDSCKIKVQSGKRTNWVLWEGIADTGGKTAWLNGGLNSLVHELGHTWGLYHANALECNKKPIDNIKYCQDEDMNDPFDQMGKADKGGYFNAVFKQKLKWPITSQLITKETIDSDGTGGIYKISPLEKKTVFNTPQLIKISIPYGSSSYYLEYRQPIGNVDQYIPLKTYTDTHDITGAVLIRRTSKINPETVTLIDTQPKTESNFKNAFLLDGRYFYDQINKILITQISNDENQAVVRVQFDELPPTPTLTPTPTPYPCENYNNNEGDCLTVPVDGKGCVWCEKNKECVNIIANPGFRCD